MAREIVLDANVIIAQLDGADTLAVRAQELTERLSGEGAEPVLLDFLVAEALSVICRRARERKGTPPELAAVLGVVREWVSSGAIRWVARDAESLWTEILDVIERSQGRLNFNDALLVVLQQMGSIAMSLRLTQASTSSPSFAAALERPSI
jgi:predicted nucleic acid-binding protein